MENIDDLMRQKFDADDPQERFEFQEEYWEQAQALLQRDEDQRRKKFWLFLGIAVALLLLAWLLYGHPGFLSKNGMESGDSTSLIENTENQPTANQKPANEQLDKSGTTPENQAAPAAKSSGQEAEYLNLDKPGVQPENLPSRISKQGNFRTETSRLVEFGTEKASGSTGNRKSTSPKSTNSKTDQAAEQRFKTSDAEAATVNKTGTNSGNSAVPLLKEPQPANDQKFQNIENNPPRNAGIVPESAPGNPALDSLQSADFFRSILIFNLPTPVQPLPIPARRIDLKKRETVNNLLAGKIINPAKDDRRFGLEFSMAGAIYPKSDTNSQNLGWTIGANSCYRINRHWSAQLGAQWRFIPGYGAASDAMNPVKVENLRYSFGYQREKWERETRGLHYLEIPLSIRWTMRRFGLDAGGTFGTLIAVQNTITKTTAASLEDSKTSVQKFVQGDKQAYNSQYYAAFAGISYQLNNRISVMTRGQYRFTPVFKTPGEGEKNTGLENLEIGLRARLF